MTVFYYPATWAAACNLQRISLHFFIIIIFLFWEGGGGVDAVIQGACHD